jgi:flavodoxin
VPAAKLQEVRVMHALVVFESHWGNTAAVAEAIAAGIGPGARAIPTSEATPELVQAADLGVAGAPVMAFGLPGERAMEGIRIDP